MQFDLVLTNPPFQDYANRGKTRHKLWIDFTVAVTDRYLAHGGTLCQVSPASFQSASSAVLNLMRRYRTSWINFDTGGYFPDVASTFADYAIQKTSHDYAPTQVTNRDGEQFELLIDDEMFYLPNDLCDESLGIHRKVVASAQEHLKLEKDYVTCHNILVRRNPAILSRTKTEAHPHPVLHTNSQTWWSSVRQEFADVPKVMWSRSGYTKPFFDDGVLGGTDMAYFVRVNDEAAGVALTRNLNSSLLQYIFRTAKWSGFGNERVFAHLPAVLQTEAMSDEAMFARFDLSDKEADYVRSAME